MSNEHECFDIYSFKYMKYLNKGNLSVYQSLRPHNICDVLHTKYHEMKIHYQPNDMQPHLGTWPFRCCGNGNMRILF